MLKHLTFIFIFLVFGTSRIVAETVNKLTILQTTDIHAHLLTKYNHTGWLQIATKIRQERKKHGKNNILLIDCGDTLEGSFIGSYTKGALPFKLLSLLNYDIWVPGNHDFDYGISELQSYVNQFYDNTLAGNLQWIKNTAEQPKRWKLIHRAGMKIAVIGITYPNLKRFWWAPLLNDIRLISTKQTLDEVIPAVMKAHPNLIILAIHKGLAASRKNSDNNLYRILKSYPQINIVLTGHIHQQFPGEKVYSTWHAQSSCHGNDLLKLTVLYSPSKHKITSITSSLIEMNEDTPIDKTIFEQIKKEYYQIRKFSYQKVGFISTPLTQIGTSRYTSPIAAFYGKAIIQATSADIAFIAPGPSTKPLQGEINRYQLYKRLPFHDKIIILNLTRNELQQIIQEGVKQYSPSYFMLPYGLQFSVNRKKQITITNISAKPTNGTYRVAFTSYALAGANNHLPILEKIAKRHKKTAIITTKTPHDIVLNSLQK